MRFGCVEIVETLQNGTKVHSMESASFPRSSLARAIGYDGGIIYDVHDGILQVVIGMLGMIGGRVKLGKLVSW